MTTEVVFFVRFACLVCHVSETTKHDKSIKNAYSNKSACHRTAAAPCKILHRQSYIHYGYGGLTKLLSKAKQCQYVINDD